MSVIIKLTGDTEYAEYIGRLPRLMQEAIGRKMESLATDISERIKEKLSGEVLQARTGKLRNSIYARIYMGSTNVTMSFGSRGDVSYAEIHETGGFVSHPGVPNTMNKTMPMSNKMGAINQFSRSTRPHQIPIPRRSYIKSTRDEMLPSINSKLLEAMREVSGGPF
jgi:phage gpG-like protein